jgi:transcriptional regulator with XRE-family HTH domain
VSSTEGDICVRFGKRLRKLRTERGWTQTDVAVHLGMDRSFLSDLERGKREPCLRTLEVIAQGFEMSLPQLLSRIRIAAQNGFYLTGGKEESNQLGVLRIHACRSANGNYSTSVGSILALRNSRRAVAARSTLLPHSLMRLASRRLQNPSTRASVRNCSLSPSFVKIRK